tara:strand:- start:215 stop:433 length:219 start_codon:yes stop_codon:yes gene_type:complete
MNTTIRRNEETAQVNHVFLWAYEKCLETGKEYSSDEELCEAVNEGHTSPTTFTKSACSVALEKLAWPNLYRG